MDFLSAIVLITIIIVIIFMVYTIKTKSKLGKVHVINSQTQEVLLNIKNYFECEMMGQYNNQDVIKKCVLATKLSESTI